MDPTLRPALPGDAAAVADVLIASRRAFMPYAPSAHSDADTREWVQHTLLATARVHVATVADRVVAVLATARDEDAGCSWIDQLYILPGHTGQKLGAQLLAHAHTELPLPIRLYTFQANAGARRFYERHGYRAIALTDGADNEEKCPDVLYELAAVAGGV